jgi:hypothetical protein
MLFDENVIVCLVVDFGTELREIDLRMRFDDLDFQFIRFKRAHIRLMTLVMRVIFGLRQRYKTAEYKT